MTVPNVIINKIIELTSKGSQIIDIGAHRGEEAFPLSTHIGSNGKIFAFECNPTLVEYLNTEIEKNSITNIEVVKLGVSDKEEEIEFRITPNDGQSSSFVKECIDKHDALYDKVYPGQLFFNHPETYGLKVKTTTLDKYFSNRTKKIDFIKSDAQGADPYILKGAQKLITNDRPHLILEWLLVSDELSTWAFHFLKNLGYKIFHLTRLDLGEATAPEQIFSSYLWQNSRFFDLLCTRDF